MKAQTMIGSPHLFKTYAANISRPLVINTFIGPLEFGLAHVYHENVFFSDGRFRMLDEAFVIDYLRPAGKRAPVDTRTLISQVSSLGSKAGHLAFELICYLQSYEKGHFDSLPVLPLSLRQRMADTYSGLILREAVNIKAGCTCCYAMLNERAVNAALSLGITSYRGSSRAAGNALALNPYLLLVPCHRILSAAQLKGGLGTLKFMLGPEVKRKLLIHEGVSLPCLKG